MCLFVVCEFFVMLYGVCLIVLFVCVLCVRVLRVMCGAMVYGLSFVVVCCLCALLLIRLCDVCDVLFAVYCVFMRALLCDVVWFVFRGVLVFCV